MFQPRAGRWVSWSDILVTSWRRGSVTVPKDSNLNRRCLMSMMSTDRPGNMEHFCKLTRDELALGSELVTQGFHLPLQQTSMI
jgi:hypothetical protein